MFLASCWYHLHFSWFSSNIFSIFFLSAGALLVQIAQSNHVVRSPRQKVLYIFQSQLWKCFLQLHLAHCMALTFLLVHSSPNHSWHDSAKYVRSPCNCNCTMQSLHGLGFSAGALFSKSLLTWLCQMFDMTLPNVCGLHSEASTNLFSLGLAISGWLHWKEGVS